MPSPTLIVVLGLDESEGDVRLVIEDVVGTLSLAAANQLAATMIRPLVKLTSWRICDISSQPAYFTAGVMNFVQMSRSLSTFLFMKCPSYEATKTR